ncbi:MAG: hypothetical protein AB7I30_07375, partial [Isosphaeraceae bacterium]
MLTTRLLDPDGEEIRRAIDVGLQGANFRVVQNPPPADEADKHARWVELGKGQDPPRGREYFPSSRPVKRPERWADQILGSPEGIALFEGGIVSDREYHDDDDDDDDDEP